MVDFVERNPRDPHQRSKPKPPPPASGRPKPKKISEGDIRVKCPACGRKFGVLSALAGSEAECPGCSKPVPVPKSDTGLSKPEGDEPKRGKPKPAPDPTAKKAPDGEGGKPKASARKVRPKVDLKTQPKCPECEVILEPDAVICVNCGYDLRSKQRNVVRREKRINPIIPILVLCALVGGSYAVYEFVLKPQDDPTATPPAVSPAQIEPEPQTDDPMVGAVEASAEEEVRVVEIDTRPEPVAEPEPAPEPVVEAAPEPMIVEPVVEVVPRSDIRERMAEKLDQQYPLASVGEPVHLTTLDGVEYNGSLTSMEGSTISLQQDGTEIMLQTKTLERRSRARLDRTYREAMIDQLTDKYLARKAAN